MKNRVLIISIFIVTFIIVTIGIFVGIKYLNPLANKTAAIPALTSATLVCTTSSSNTSLTINWTAPASATTDMKIGGNIIDTTTSQNANALTPLPVKQGTLPWTNANGTDKYKVTLWIQDSTGAKGTTTSTNEIDSSQCTSGSQPVDTSSVTVTDTITVTASATDTPTQTATETDTPTTTDTNLPGTANEVPLIFALILGLMFTIFGGILFFKEKID